MTTDRKNNMNDVEAKKRYAIAFLITAIFIVVLGPFLFIWSLNTLFGLTIAYGFFEWLAGLLLLGYLKAGSVKSS
jgi:hypothetical protein